MIDLLRVIRFSLRQHRRRPAWALAVILVLAIGIGANTSMFSAFDVWVLRPLDFESPERLVALHEAQPLQDRQTVSVSPPNLEDWRREQRSFEGLAAFYVDTYNLADEAEPARVEGAHVTADLFPLLGKEPILGRQFAAEEDVSGQPGAVALISYELWRDRYGQDEEILGRTIRLEGRQHEIIGVMEPDFAFPAWSQVWTPAALDPLSTDRASRYLSVIGRLLPEVSREAASEDLSAISDRLAARYPDSNRGWSANVDSLRSLWVPDVIYVALSASLGAAFLVLLVICANVASLVLARATARGRETAVRTALGAGRGELLRQSLLEGMVLALPAGLVGLLVAWLSNQWMLSVVPMKPPYLFALRLDARVVVYTVVMALVAGALCGLMPLFRSRLKNPAAALSSGARSAAKRSSSRVRALLVTGQLAMSTSLLIGAVLMVKSFLALQGGDPGFRVDNVLTAVASLDDETRERSEYPQRVERLLAQLKEVPGVLSVGVTNQLPVSDWNRIWGLEAEGRPLAEGEAVLATVETIAGDYMETLAVPLRAGRPFQGSELEQGAPLALVSEGLAQRLWGGVEAAVGSRLRARRIEDAPWLEVIGVVSDVDVGEDMTRMGQVPTVQLYVPYAASPGTEIVVAVHTERPMGLVAPEIRAAFHEALPGVPVSELLSMEDAIARVLWVSRFFSEQLILYALLATVIAALGLYGLVADSVAQRRQELAIRMALGAKTRDLLRLVLREVMILSGLGVVVGLVLSGGVTRFAAGMLAEVNVRDPLVYSGVALLLLGVTLLAGYFPARRATRLDPSHALRAE